jgi:hypothetical protein
MICQQYVSKPFLIDGFKFDLRIYILISSCDPLRIFVYKDGLARFATVQYNEPSNSNTVSSLIKKLASFNGDIFNLYHTFFRFLRHVPMSKQFS